ncbi:MAG: M4 family metallopeptidase [Patescibacteria group bacterium]
MPKKQKIKHAPAKLKLAVAPSTLGRSFERNLVPALILVAAAIMSVAYFNYSTGEAGARVKMSLSPSAFRRPQVLGLISSTDIVTKKFTFLAASSTRPIVLSVSNLQNERAVARQFFTDYGKYFGVKNFANELKLLKSLTDEAGVKYLRYNQIHKGVPVFGAQLAVQVNSDLSVNSAGGRFVPNIGINVKPQITAKKAEGYAREIAAEQFGMRDPNFSRVKLYIFNKSIINQKANNKNHLVWQVDASDSKTYGRKILFIDAKTGELIYYFEGDRDAINRKIYHCNSVSGVENCKLWNDDGLDGGRREGEAASGFADVDDLYTFIGNTHSYYKDKFNLDGANGTGGTGSGGDFQVTSTYGLSYFVYPVTVSTTCPNATWDGYYVKFCQGVINLPIVAHEYTHSVSDYAFGHPNEPGMVNAYETGAIEEGFADVFAMGVERYVNGASSWKMNLPPLGVIRDISDPASTPGRALPARFYDPNFYCGDDDKGGVHRNSTVISNMIYNLVNGADFNGCLIGAVSQDKVERILYNARKFTFSISEKFNDLYNDLNVACGLRYGGQSYECKQLRTAMQAAEIDQPGLCSGVARVKPACDVPRLDSSRLNTDVNPLDSLSSDQIKVNLPDSVTQPVISLPINTNLNPTTDAVVSSTNNSASSPQPTTPVVPEVTDRNPNFSVAVNWVDGKTLALTGKITYYGLGSKCDGPRYFVPTIVRWGDGNGATDEITPTKNADGTYSFSPSHTYVKMFTNSWNLSVTVHNECFGSGTKQIIIKAPTI